MIITRALYFILCGLIVLYFIGGTKAAAPYSVCMSIILSFILPLSKPQDVK
jgi:hypothetical protein